MKKISTFLLSLTFISSLAIEAPYSKTKLAFKENKGQISDQYNKSRPDVLFTGNVGDLAFQMKKDGISYQFCEVNKWSENSRAKSVSSKNIKRPEQSTLYRIDINWINSNTEVIERLGEIPGYDNYYLPVCPNGVTFVKSYSDITYKNLYNGINLHYYYSDEQLKYDYIVSPHSDYKKIKLEINGADKIYINEKKELIIETPLGNITEQAPLVFQEKRILDAEWKVSKNIVSFEIQNINPDLSFTIDPLVRTWGTFYGGSGDDYGFFCQSDNSGNIYLTGTTNYVNTGLATTGAFQVLYGGGGSDAFLIKFNTNGTRIWGTYYGDAGLDEGHSLACDIIGNVYMTGWTDASPNKVHASIGCYQSAFSGWSDGFLAKFNSSGLRIWGTLYGGSGFDEVNGCCIDNSGDLHFVGLTQGDVNNFKIVTPGAYQTTFAGGNGDALYGKFDSNGNRLYATYFGGSGDENSYSCSVDANGNLFFAGITNSSVTTISTIGSHQNTFGGGNRDAFLGKFGTNGMLHWATYYGGSDLEEGFSCTADALGNVFLCGYTGSTNNIGTPGTHKPNITLAPASDVFLAKFNNNGVRQWGTYYGGGNGEVGRCCIVNKISGDIYITGETSSFGIIGDIPTLGCHQDTLGGIDDAFLAKFNTNGALQWGTYCGGNWEDWAFGVTLDPIGNIYITGFSDSTSPNSISTPGCFQSMPATVAYDIFLVKFFDSGTTGIDIKQNTENLSCIAYPNPTSHFLNILSNQNNLLNPKLEITNSLGQTVLKSEFKNQVDVSFLSPGCYFIKISSDEKNYYSKFVKE